VCSSDLPRRIPSGPAGTGKPRLIAVDLERAMPRRLRGWLVVSDAPLDEYGETAINQRLHDLDSVARAAVAHERVIETFASAPALLPMKLFTIFTSDDRAVDHLLEDPARLRSILSRVMDHDEWGIRLMFDGAQPTPAARSRSRAAPTGVSYLSGKKAQHDRTAQLAAHARKAASDLRVLTQQHASLVRGRQAREMPVPDGPLLFDEALLVPRTRTGKFRAAVAREARRLQPQGFRVVLTGPWPPYSFLQD